MQGISCLRSSFSLCPKQAKGVTGVQVQVGAEPIVLVNGDEKPTLKFDCRTCEMHVMGKMKKHILKSPPPSVVPVVFHRQRPGGRLRPRSLGCPIFVRADGGVDPDQGPVTAGRCPCQPFWVSFSTALSAFFRSDSRCAISSMKC